MPGENRLRHVRETADLQGADRLTEEEKDKEEMKVLHKIHQNERTLVCLESNGNRMAEEMAKAISVIQWKRTEENTFKIPPEIDPNWKNDWPSAEEIDSYLMDVEKTKGILRGLYGEAERLRLNYDRKFRD